MSMYVDPSVSTSNTSPDDYTVADPAQPADLNQDDLRSQVFHALLSGATTLADGTPVTDIVGNDGAIIQQGAFNQLTEPNRMHVVEDFQIDSMIRMGTTVIKEILPPPGGE